jgi:hypothetical protein
MVTIDKPLEQRGDRIELEKGGGSEREARLDREGERDRERSLDGILTFFVKLKITLFFFFSKKKEALATLLSVQFQSLSRSLTSAVTSAHRVAAPQERARGKEREQQEEKEKKNVEEKNQNQSHQMFYSLTLEKELELQPRFFGPRMREVLQQKLISEVN